MMKVSNNKRNILIFRTSITTKLEIERIKILFAQYSQIHKWNLDFEYITSNQYLYIRTRIV